MLIQPEQGGKPMKESKISHRQLLKKEDAIAFLESMASSLKSGKVVIERNGQFVSLVTPEIMNMELSARDKKDKNELCIEFSWRKEPFIPDVSPLNITSLEPPEPEEPEEPEEKKAAKEADKADAAAKSSELIIKSGADAPKADASKDDAAKPAHKSPLKK